MFAEDFVSKLPENWPKSPPCSESPLHYSSSVAESFGYPAFDGLLSKKGYILLCLVAAWGGLKLFLICLFLLLCYLWFVVYTNLPIKRGEKKLILRCPLLTKSRFSFLYFVGLWTIIVCYFFCWKRVFFIHFRIIYDICTFHTQTTSVVLLLLHLFKFKSKDVFFAVFPLRHHSDTTQYSQREIFYKNRSIDKILW